MQRIFCHPVRFFVGRCSLRDASVFEHDEPYLATYFILKSSGVEFRVENSDVIFFEKVLYLNILFVFLNLFILFFYVDF